MNRIRWLERKITSTNTPTPRKEYASVNSLFYYGYQHFKRRKSPIGRGKPNFRLAGKNHPNGVLFNFLINDYENHKVSLEIQDLAGNTVQVFSSDTREKKQQLKIGEDNNRFVWDMQCAIRASWNLMV